MHFLKNTSLITFSLILFLASSCSKADKPQRKIVAQVGDRAITVEHLKRSFALDPKWGAGLTNEEAYRNQLNYLIDEKLFAQEAVASGLAGDPTLSGYLDFIADKESIKALYEHVVREKVEISETEYEQAYLNSKKKVSFSYIYTRDSKRAQTFYNLLKVSDLDSIQINPNSGEKKGTTRFMTFGDLAPEIEAFVFDMKPGQVQKPIEILDGYMVIKLKDGVIEKFTSEMELAQNKNKLEKIIYDRKAAPIANQYIKDLMLPKNLTLNPDVFYKLSGMFSKLAQQDLQEEPSLIPVQTTDAALNFMTTESEMLSGEILATYEGGKLTVGQFLANLQNMPGGFRPQLKMAKQLKDAVGVQVRNYFLAKEAREQGLHKLPEVRHKIEIQQDHILAQYYLSSKRMALDISEKEIDDYIVSPRYAALTASLQQKPAEETVKTVLEDIKMSEFKINAFDALSRKYPVTVDSTVFHLLVPDKESIIDQDPTPFLMREIFN